MPEVKIITNFNFEEFCNQNQIYKKYIRIKGQAMLEISDISVIGRNQLEIDIDNHFSKKRKFILIFKVKNEIYHIPVIVKDVLADNKGTCRVERTGQVLCLVERRDYERITINQEIEYYIVENRIQQFYKGIMQDMSASGAKLITKSELNTKHPIILNTTNLDFPLNELQGKIVWKERKDNKFFNGIHFEFKEDKRKDLLMDFLY